MLFWIGSMSKMICKLSNLFFFLFTSCKESKPPWNRSRFNLCMQSVWNRITCIYAIKTGFYFLFLNWKVFPRRPTSFQTSLHADVFSSPRCDQTVLSLTRWNYTTLNLQDPQSRWLPVTPLCVLSQIPGLTNIVFLHLLGRILGNVAVSLHRPQLPISRCKVLLIAFMLRAVMRHRCALCFAILGIITGT